MTIYSGRSRLLLKMLLWESRGNYSPRYGKVPTCPLCEQPIASPAEADLHEALLTRRDVMRTSNPDAIMTGLNCVLVHHKCHMQIVGHGGDDTFRKCAIHLMEHEGYLPVHQWFEEIASRFPALGRRALLHLEAVYRSEQGRRRSSSSRRLLHGPRRLKVRMN